MSATIRDVAEQAGVSIATVSRVMNDHPDVGQDTRRRVLDAAELLGYVAHGPARTLAAGRSHLIALVIGDGIGRPEVALSFFGEVIDSVVRHLEEHEYDGVLLHSASHHGHTYVERAISHGVDGLMVLGNIDPDRLAQAPPELPLLGIEIDCDGPARGSVIFDDADGIRLCVRHLYALGHRSFAYVGGPTPSRPAVARLDAFRAETAALGVEPPADLVRETDFSAEAGYREACSLLAGRDRPTAIVCASDVIAIAAMQALRDFGLEPGRDVAVTGFDDLPIASLAHPPLTTVRQDRERIGAVAVAGLVEMIEAPDEPGPQLRLPVTLVVRSSSGGRTV